MNWKVTIAFTLNGQPNEWYWLVKGTAYQVSTIETPKLIRVVGEKGGEIVSITMDRQG